MRNLQLLYQIKSAPAVEEILTHFTVGAEQDDIFFVTESHILYGLHPSTNKIWLELPLDQEDLLSQDSTVIGIEYIPDLEAVCIVTRGGEIVVYEISTNEVMYAFLPFLHDFANICQMDNSF